MINKKYGKLLVIENLGKIGKDKGDYYKCICECGKEVNVLKYNLTRGRAKSCGCISYETRRKNVALKDELMHNHVGKKINSWTILKFEGRFNDKKIYFLCRCDCGTEKLVNGYNLLQSRTKDCGCGRNKNLQKMLTYNEIGNKYGKLTVLEYVGRTSYKKILYLCECSCGTKVIKNISVLRNGSSSSCGCLKISSGELKIKTFLEENGITFIQEKVFEDCKFKLPLKFDFYIRELNACIEYDGEYHYYVTNFNSQDKLTITKLRDDIKTKYCLDNNIKLIRIPYWEKSNIDKILLEELITLND